MTRGGGGLKQTVSAACEHLFPEVSLLLFSSSLFSSSRTRPFYNIVPTALCSQLFPMRTVFVSVLQCPFLLSVAWFFCMFSFPSRSTCLRVLFVVVFDALPCPNALLALEFEFHNEFNGLAYCSHIPEPCRFAFLFVALILGKASRIPLPLSSCLLLLYFLFLLLGLSPMPAISFPVHLPFVLAMFSKCSCSMTKLGGLSSMGRSSPSFIEIAKLKTIRKRRVLCGRWYCVPGLTEEGK